MIKSSTTSLCQKLFCCTMLFMILAAMPGVSRASVVPLSLEQLVAISDEIVVVRIQDTSSTMQNQQIRTTAKLGVLDRLKGSSKETVMEMTYPGGKVGKLVMDVAAVPVLRKDEEAILFLSRPIDRLPKDRREKYDLSDPLVQSYSIVGGFQGKFTIDNLSDQGARTRKGMEPVPAKAEVSRFRGPQRDGTRAKTANYDSFVSAIEQLVAEENQKKARSGAQDEIAGVYGRFAVPTRSANPVVRSFDPLPTMAYMTDKELSKVKAKLRDDILKAEKERETRKKEADELKSRKVN